MTVQRLRLATCFGMPPDLFDTVLWGWTGYPCFWGSSNPIKELWYRLHSIGRFWRRFNALPADHIEEALRYMRADSFTECWTCECGRLEGPTFAACRRCKKPKPAEVKP